jgi:hypothetical protein
MHRASVCGITIVAALLALAPVARASTSQETIFEDDGCFSARVKTCRRARSTT